MLDHTIFTYSLKFTHEMKEILHERSLICTYLSLWSLFHAASISLLVNGINLIIKHILPLREGEEGPVCAGAEWRLRVQPQRTWTSHQLSGKF